jgi:hypothetical protein
MAYRILKLAFKLCVLTGMLAPSRMAFRAIAADVAGDLKVE